MGLLAAMAIILSCAAAEPQPHVVFLCNEDEYHARETLPSFARDLQEKFGCRCTVLIGQGDDGFKGLDALKTADAMVLFVRRRALPKEQLDEIRAYCNSGKPLVGLRTASHAFAKKTKVPAGHAEWPEFDREVLGGNYHNHGKQNTEVKVAPEAAGHPLLAGIDPQKWTSKSTLYFTSPLDKQARVLLMGSSEGKSEPVAWTHTYKGSRVFYTSLGHQDDFATAQFRTLLTNAIFWSMDRPLPDGKNSGVNNPLGIVGNLLPRPRRIEPVAEDYILTAETNITVAGPDLARCRFHRPATLAVDRGGVRRPNEDRGAASCRRLAALYRPNRGRAS